MLLTAEYAYNLKVYSSYYKLLIKVVTSVKPKSFNSIEDNY
jgi:hypothetical protein